MAFAFFGLVAIFTGLVLALIENEKIIDRRAQCTEAVAAAKERGIIGENPHEQRAREVVLSRLDFACDANSFTVRGYGTHMVDKVLAYDESDYADCYWRRAADITATYFENKSFESGDVSPIARVVREEAEVPAGFACDRSAVS